MCCASVAIADARGGDGKRVRHAVLLRTVDDGRRPRLRMRYVNNHDCTIQTVKKSLRGQGPRPSKSKLASRQLPRKHNPAADAATPGKCS